uniref:S1 motif domain-containing protein n=1 Tax=viral metagenome TaxID=1070528 RepID=A0A6C0IMQ0_9ZZZZ
MNQDKQKIFGVYTPSMLTMKIGLHITQVGSTLKKNLEEALSSKVEGKCNAEGYIKPGSCTIMSYSSGSVNGDFIEFQVVFECYICYPVEGMNIECKVKTITKAGIHGEVVDRENNMPLTVFVARDHHYNDKIFGNVKEGDNIVTSTIGVRFELNDPFICVIAKLIDYQTGNEDRKLKPRINLAED